jgi:hypothetical protein
MWQLLLLSHGLRLIPFKFCISFPYCSPCLDSSVIQLRSLCLYSFVFIGLAFSWLTCVHQINLQATLTLLIPSFTVTFLQICCFPVFFAFSVFFFCINCTLTLAYLLCYIFCDHMHTAHRVFLFCDLFLIIYLFGFPRQPPRVNGLQLFAWPM